MRFFTWARVANLLEFWPPMVACVLGLGAVLADLFWARFQVFALGHAMITALFSMVIFAVLTAWFTDWLAVRRERSKRTAVTGNAVRVTAEMGWEAVSHAGMSWQNLKNPQVREELMRCLRAYNSQVAILALTPNADTNFLALLACHDRLGAALDSFFLARSGSRQEESEKFEEIRQLQAAVDAASWPYIEAYMPSYWDDPGKFTPPFYEPPPWYRMMPKRPVRIPPFGKYLEPSSERSAPMVNLGGHEVSKFIDEVFVTMKPEPEVSPIEEAE
ncbi:hypothetical protein [Actinomyces sp. oral taxon 175]|uniref:hypothetical protein n=1 Tax=Actinomyces sp. oral taxon 175 TaxID=712119 RepID=UPI00021D31D8|nr:hypothetical protein [Actinomyces sp. oral taxon 175]EGV14472.1 hypothetical protein HMPREF9058_1467 [Actinomyces sp. oral taxon 175 str. F0384]